MGERISEKYGKEPGILTEYMDFLVEKRELSPSTAYNYYICLLYTSPSPRARTRSRMTSTA